MSSHPSHEGKQGLYATPTPNTAPTHQHYKGGLYWKLFDAYTEVSIAPMVVYQGSDGVVWIRTREDFEAVVDKKTKTLRFAPVS